MDASQARLLEHSAKERAGLGCRGKNSANPHGRPRSRIGTLVPQAIRQERER